MAKPQPQIVELSISDMPAIEEGIEEEKYSPTDPVGLTAAEH